MALDLSVLSQLHPVAPPPNPIEQMAHVVALKNALTQGQDLQAQVQERQAAAQQRALAAQKQQRLGQILSTAKVNPETGAPDSTSPEMQQLFREFPEVHSALMEHYSKVATDAATRKNLESEATNRETPEERERLARLKIDEPTTDEKNFQAWRKGMNLEDNAASRVQYKVQGQKLSPDEIIAGAPGQPPLAQGPAKPKPLDLQELDQFNQNPGLVAQFGTGPLGLSAKKQADQLKLHTSEAAQTAAAQNALQQGAVKNVAPHLVNKATEDYSKDSKAYVDTAQAADDMKAFIADARSGNKVAYSFLPAEGALYLTTSRGVKRVNTTEMEAFGGGGSAWDRVKAFLGKQASGASIPANILTDMDGLTQSVGANAKTAYQRKVAVTNQSYGSTFKPMEFSDGPSAAAPIVQHSASTGQYRYSTDGGKTWQPGQP